MEGLFGPFHWLILAVIVLLLFGNRLPGVMRSLGLGVVEFKKGLQGIQEDVNNGGTAKDKTKIEADQHQAPGSLGRDRLDPVRAEEFGDFGELAAIMAGQHQPRAGTEAAHHPAASIAARCNAKSSSVPARARPSRVASASSPNVARSAVA